MDKNAVKELIARRVAKELKDGDVVNLGIGLPTLVPKYLPENVTLILQSENGIIGVGRLTDENKDVHITDAGGNPAAIIDGGCYFDSCTSFGIIRGGHVDATVLGALQVSENGDISNWIIPGKMIAGMGGAMDLVSGVDNVIVAMLHTQKGQPKILKKNTLPLTAAGCVKTVITEMGVMRIRPEGIVLEEFNPEYTIDEIVAATEATLIISDDLKPML
ncbi:MAG: 3-oxoacid CoA-transferase subunit B [Ruminococcaceae bacterium]|nr:3-oxoacid CoA-transferase subunit B [Oscillospiraceae bacterium]